MRSRSLLLSIAVFVCCACRALAEPKLGPDYPTYQVAYACLALSGDGKVAVFGSRDGAAFVWNTAFTQRLQTLRGATGETTSVAISHDGKRIVTGSENQTAILWDTATGKKLQIFRGHTDAVTSVAMTADGNRVLTGSKDNTAILWDAQTGKKIHTLENHKRDVRSVAITPGGNLIVTGSEDETAIIWDAATGKKLQTFTSKNWFKSVSISADGKRLLTGDGSGSAYLWDTATGKTVLTLEMGEDSSDYVALTQDGKMAFAGGQDGTTIAWDAVTGKKLHALSWHKYGIVGIAVSAEGKKFLAGGMYSAELSNTVTGDPIENHSEYFNPPTGCLSLSTDGTKLAVGVWGGTTMLWDAAAGKIVQSFDSPPHDVDHVALSADGKHLVTGQHNAVIAWDVVTGKKVRTLPRSGNVSSVGISNDGKQVAMLLNGSVTWWDVATGKEAARGKNPDGAALEAALADRRLTASGISVEFRDMTTNKVLRTFKGHTDDVTCVTLSADGNRAVTGSKDYSAILWDTKTGEKIHTFKGHKHQLTCLALSTDGKHLWSGSWDNTTRLWDTATGKELCALVPYDGGHEWLIATPAGYFDGSEGGINHMAWHDKFGGDKRVDDEVTFKKFHRPGLLPALLKGERAKE